MEIVGSSLDDLLYELYSVLMNTEHQNVGTRGLTRELLGVTLRLENPLARISWSENRGKPFSAIGELLWYLKQSDKIDFIEPYLPEYKNDAVDGILPGAYGPRIFQMRDGIEQFENVTNLLKENPNSKRAVVQLFNAEDIVKRLTEIPCTTCFQFILRDSVLHMSVNMRSNDVYFGLPHDVFCFTMLQEMLARRLNVEVGDYIHHVGSMHVYERHFDKLEEFIDEGFQKLSPMPRMSAGDPFDWVPSLLAAESQSRYREAVDMTHLDKEPYWADIARMIEAFWHSGDSKQLNRISSELDSSFYKQFIDCRYSKSIKVIPARR